METITLQSIKDALSKNAFQSESVPQIHIGRYIVDIDNEMPETEGWVRRPLGLGGPMALILRSKNHLFRGASVSLQKVLLREAVTEAQNSSPSVLKGRKWPLRRVSEALASCLSSKVPEGQTCAWNEMCFAAICEMENIQIILVNVEKQEISFAPTDLSLWKRDNDIYAMSTCGQWLFAPVNAETESEAWPAKEIGGWLSKMEDAKWKISWPIADGTMEELRTTLEDAGLAVEGRLKKDELARRAGRTNAVRLLSKWFLEK